MQHISKNLTELSKPHLEPAQRIFSDQEREAVRYFYQELKAIYQGAYDGHFKSDERLVKVSKRKWAAYIGRYSEEQIDKGVAWIQKQKIDHIEGWQYFDVGRCVGAIKQANTVKACHKIYDKSKALQLLKANPKSEKVMNSREQLNGLFT